MTRTSVELIEQQSYESPILLNHDWLFEWRSGNANSSKATLLFGFILSLIFFFIIADRVQSGIPLPLDGATLMVLHSHTSHLIDRIALTVCTLVTVISVGISLFLPLPTVLARGDFLAHGDRWRCNYQWFGQTSFSNVADPIFGR
jgi:hypothetical protein